MARIKNGNDDSIMFGYTMPYVAQRHVFLETAIRQLKYYARMETTFPHFKSMNLAKFKLIQAFMHVLTTYKSIKLTKSRRLSG